MAEKDVSELFQQLRASHGSEPLQIQNLVDKLQSELDARSHARKKLLWQALAGSELPHMLQSKKVSEEALQDRNPKLRMAALLLLCHHWPRTAQLSEQCEQLAFSDPDVQVRAMALAEIGFLYKGTNDPRVGAMLANFVYDHLAPVNLRRSAYWSLYELRGLPLFPLYRSGVLKREMAFPEDCDWTFVESFRPGRVP